ncbi:MAG: ribosome small subunit-dependent GTPase A [Bdellovibrionota bacterium]
MNIRQLGWVHDGGHEYENTNQIARITSIHRGVCCALGNKGEYNVYLSGKFHQQVATGVEVPAVGDWIVLGDGFVDQQNKASCVLKEILPRKSMISRMAAGKRTQEQVIAANVDALFIVCSLNQDFKISRIHRYVFMASSGKIKPIIVLSKCDLVKEVDEVVKILHEHFPLIDVVVCSSFSGHGMGELRAHIEPLKTYAFVGSSGVGKSSIVNTLMEDEVQLVQGIRGKDDRGKHTTTSRQLFLLPGGAMVIDTPGLREIQITGDEDALSEMSGEIEEIAQQCRFSNCGHTQEPGCMVQTAIAEGSLSAEDLERYRKYQKELAFVREKTDKRLHAQSKKKWKKLNLDMRKRKKEFG